MYAEHQTPRKRKGTNTRQAILVALALAAITLACYSPLATHPFIAFDDHDYISQNPQVAGGLSWLGFVWAFTQGHAANWHPLTWLSHMLDCQLFGLNAGLHHIVNALLHTLNAVLVFVLFRQMTGAFWRSALVAALFAWHPLHVESVAWASERKDTLSCLFWLLTLIAYVRYARSRTLGDFGPIPGPQVGTHSTASPLAPRQSDQGRSGMRPYREWKGFPRAPLGGYLLVLFLFACGLMSKPMVVTLPCVLLLLDFWPLNRLGPSQSAGQDPADEAPQEWGLQSWLKQAGKLFLEKLPLFGLTLASSAVTCAVQKGAMSSLDALPFTDRLANAIVSYGRYLAKTLWPSNLAVVYPYEPHVPAALVIGVALLLVLLTIGCLLCAKRAPFLIVGWLWFLGTLVPVIGLIQVGSQSMADRYMYIPAIGLFVMVVWGVSALIESQSPERLPLLRKTAALAGAAALAVLLGCSFVQVGVWRSNEALFGHATKVTADNYIALDQLGAAYEASGRRAEGMATCAQAVRLKPNYPEARYNLGTMFLKQGDLDQAAQHLEIAVRKKPNFADAHINLGKVFLAQDKLDQAVASFRAGAAAAPADPEAHYSLGTALLMKSQVDDAARCLDEALRLKPGYAEAHRNLAIALMRQGKIVEGASHFCSAVQISPRDPEAHRNLGVALLQLGQPAKAESCLIEAVRLEPKALATRYDLALAVARQKRLEEAATQAKGVLELALAQGQQDVATQAEELVKACQRGESP
jgi:tetratricopeptide (TPR) repeat protein